MQAQRSGSRCDQIGIKIDIIERTDRQPIGIPSQWRTNGNSAGLIGFISGGNNNISRLQSSSNKILTQNRCGGCSREASREGECPSGNNLIAGEINSEARCVDSPATATPEGGSNVRRLVDFKVASRCCHKASLSRLFSAPHTEAPRHGGRLGSINDQSTTISPLQAISPHSAGLIQCGEPRIAHIRIRATFVTAQ